MYVIDLFNQIKIEEILKTLEDFNFFNSIFEYVIHDSNVEEHIQKLKDKFKNEYYLIQQKNVKYSTDILFVHKLLDGSDEYDYALFKLDEIENIRQSTKTSKFCEYINPFYDVMLSPRDEILGFKLSDENVNKYGKILVATVIFREMTHLGISDEEVMARQTEINESLLEAEKEIENGKTFTLEEVREHFGIVDERTDEEKQKEEDELISNIEKNIQSLIDDTKIILDEIDSRTKT